MTGYSACITTPTARERDLLDALCRKVKFFTLDQIGRGWWASGTARRSVRHRLALLEEAGWVARTVVIARPLVPSDRPLATWEGGKKVPDFASVASFARSRWNADVRAHSAVVATTAAANAVGGRARRSRPSETTHDLHLAELYLRFRMDRPEDAARWVGEAMLEHAAGSKVPDALVRRPRQCLAVEICGASYTPERLRLFHEHCARMSYGYELW